MSFFTTVLDSSLGLNQPSLRWVMTHLHPSKSTPCRPARKPSITKASSSPICAKHLQKDQSKTSNLLMKKNTQMTLKSTPNTARSTCPSTTTIMTRTKIMTVTKNTMTTTTTPAVTKVTPMRKQKRPSRTPKVALQTLSSPSSILRKASMSSNSMPLTRKISKWPFSRWEVDTPTTTTVTATDLSSGLVSSASVMTHTLGQWKRLMARMQIQACVLF